MTYLNKLAHYLGSELHAEKDAAHIICRSATGKEKKPADGKALMIGDERGDLT